MSVIWTPLRLIMMEEKEELNGRSGGSPKGKKNAEISSVTVKATTTEGLVRQRSSMFNLGSELPRSTPSPVPNQEVIFSKKQLFLSTSSLNRPNTLTTTAVLESPTKPMQETRGIERKKEFCRYCTDIPSENGYSLKRKETTEEKAEKNPVKMVDAQVNTEGLPCNDNCWRNHNRVFTTEKFEKVQAYENDACPTTELSYDTTDTIRIIDKERKMGGVEKKQEPKENKLDDCIVDCIYITMRCCECSLM